MKKEILILLTIALHIFPVITKAGGCAKDDATCENSVDTFWMLLFGYEIYPIGLILLVLFAVVLFLVVYSYKMTIDAMEHTRKEDEHQRYQ